MPPLIVLAATLVVFLIRFLDHTATNLRLLERLELTTYDWRVKLAQKKTVEVAPNLGNIYVSDDTLLAMNSRHGFTWPLPRQVYGRAVAELNAQGASVIGFDILFADLHRSDAGPRTILPNGDVLSSDEFFAREIERHTNVVLAAELGVVPPPLFATNTLALGDISKPSDADNILRKGFAFQEYRVWHPLIRQLATEYTLDLENVKFEETQFLIPQHETGENVTIPLYAEKKFRLDDFVESEAPEGEGTFLLPFEDIRVWHLGLRIAASELGLDLDAAVIEPNQIVLENSTGIRRVIPVASDNSFYITWSLAWNDPRIEKAGIEHLLEWADEREAGNPVEDLWKGKIVVIGATGTGQNVADFGATPLEKNSYLMGTYANVANMLLSDAFTRRASAGTEFLLMLCMPAILLLLRLRFHGIAHSALILLVCVGYIVTSVMIFISTHYWLPIVLPTLCMIAPQFALVSYQVIFEQKEKRRVKDVFSKLVSPNVVHELLAADQLNFGGKRKNITVMFSDVRGFTSMTDEYHKRAEAYKVEHADDPEKVEAYSDLMAQESLSNVNIYLGAISNMVKKHNGTLDKYMGDCVMAFWGAPTENEQHALSCVRASVDGQRAMHRLNLERMAENQKRKKLNVERIKNGEEPLDMLKLLSLGSGINSGVCIVGLMGSDQHILNFTVFGREVNLASRLEAVSGRGRIIIGENTYNEIKSYAPEFLEDCKPLQPVTVKGIENPVPIYEVPWMENWEEREALELEIVGEVIPLKPAAALVYDAKPKAQSLDDA